MERIDGKVYFDIGGETIPVTEVQLGDFSGITFVKWFDTLTFYLLPNGDCKIYVVSDNKCVINETLPLDIWTTNEGQTWEEVKAYFNAEALFEGMIIAHLNKIARIILRHPGPISTSVVEAIRALKGDEESN